MNSSAHSPFPVPPTRAALMNCIDMALAEDLGPSGDLTTDLLIPPSSRARARIISREPGKLCGAVVLGPLFGRLDPQVSVTETIAEGGRFEAGATLATLEGATRALLTGERIALNLMARLSGIATLTARFVQAAGGQARVVDTRKTTPGLRALERYAVRCGGGHNHRFNLSDGILIKDNHRVACADLADAVQRTRAGTPHPIRIEVEVESLEQARSARDAGADILLLDNMAPQAMEAVMNELGHDVLYEASGGVSLETIGAIAATGVDLISIGALTHSARSLDFSLELEA